MTRIPRHNRTDDLDDEGNAVHLSRSGEIAPECRGIHFHTKAAIQPGHPKPRNSASSSNGQRRSTSPRGWVERGAGHVKRVTSNASRTAPIGWA